MAGDVSPVAMFSFEICAESVKIGGQDNYGVGVQFATVKWVS